MQVTSLWHINNEKSLLRNSNLEYPKPGNKALVYSTYSMISTGTERLVIQGKIPKPIQHKMKVPYMDGSFQFPIKYGYAMAGETEDKQLVHLMHPHQNICVVEKEALYYGCTLLPKHRIPLISNMETVINAIWDSGSLDSKKIAVCGFGNIGSLLSTALITYYNCKPVIIDNNIDKQKIALNLGFEIAEPNMTFDVIYHTTASSEGLQYCIDHANEEAKIIELSWYGTKQTNLSLGLNFHTNRIRLIASQVSQIPIEKRKTFDYQKRKDLACKILQNSFFDKLISEIIPFQEAPIFFEKLRQKKENTGLIYLIKY